MIHFVERKSYLQKSCDLQGMALGNYFINLDMKRDGVRWWYLGLWDAYDQYSPIENRINPKGFIDCEIWLARIYCQTWIHLDYMMFNYVSQRCY